MSSVSHSTTQIIIISENQTKKKITSRVSSLIPIDGRRLVLQTHGLAISTGGRRGVPDNEVLKERKKKKREKRRNMWTRIRRVFFPCAFVPSITKRERDKEHSRKLSPSAVAHRSRPVSVLVTFKFTSRPSTYARCCWQSAPPVLLELPGKNI